LNLSTFDYVIIGGGTAGLVMANRLSQNPNVQVAVIEAGGLYETADPILSTTPGLDGIGIGADPSSTNSIDWNFVTQPQSCLNNRKVHYARGKCLGGT
jgi:choline dehydrogenase-like flavoprotein